LLLAVHGGPSVLIPAQPVGCYLPPGPLTVACGFTAAPCEATIGPALDQEIFLHLLRVARGSSIKPASSWAWRAVSGPGGPRGREFG